MINKFISPFTNDPFALVYMAFKNLYPDKNCECFLGGVIGNEHYGETVFEENGRVTVYIKETLAVRDAVEILAHELAHVAVGETEEAHGKEWEDALEAMSDEYERIVSNLLAEENEYE